jgi:phosphate:Na+ symporter
MWIQKRTPRLKRNIIFVLNSMIPNIDIWFFIAGLGVFLLGINQMEGGIKSLAGKSFRKYMRSYTRNPFYGILIGTIITAILQSSSVVSLMTIAFVGAGIIPLKNAVGVIFGANLGTTATGWIVASIGFKFPIESFALPVLGVGGVLVTLFSNRIFFTELGRFLIGFGALFTGIAFMKDAIDVTNIDANTITQFSIPIHLYFIVGVFLTAIIQSSSATMAITLSGLYAGLIPLDIAAAIVVGGSLGTTITVLLGTLGGNSIKKQVAYAHVGFNLVTSIIALILLHPLIHLIESFFEISDPLYILVSFYSVFTVIGVVVFLPFISRYTNLIEHIVKKDKASLAPMLNNVPPEVFEGAAEAIRIEALDLLERVKRYRFLTFQETIRSMTQRIFDQSKSLITKMYKDIQLKEGEIISYYLQIQRQGLSNENTALLEKYIHGVKKMTLAAKQIKTVLHTINRLKEQENQEEEILKNNIQEQFKSFYELLSKDGSESIIQQQIDHVYRENVNYIYTIVEKGEIKKSKLSSLLHLNSQVKSFKQNYKEAYYSIKG